jgi:hypothetical protein
MSFSRLPTSRIIVIHGSKEEMEGLGMYGLPLVALDLKALWERMTTWDALTRVYAISRTLTEAWASFQTFILTEILILGLVLCERLSRRTGFHS